MTLARMIHDGFSCNSRDAAAVSLTAGGLAARSVNILCHVAPSRYRLGSEVCLAHSSREPTPGKIPTNETSPIRNSQPGSHPTIQLRAPISQRDCVMSRRTVMNEGPAAAYSAEVVASATKAESCGGGVFGEEE